MGLGSDFLPKIKQYLCDSELTRKAADYNGMKIGVDASVWMNRSIIASNRVYEVGIANAMIPQQSIQPYIWKWLDSQLSYYKDEDIELVFVFDGERNPLKSATNTKRRLQSIAAEANIPIILKSKKAAKKWPWFCDLACVYPPWLLLAYMTKIGFH